MDVLISGAGIAGPALSAMFAETTVYDATNPSRWKTLATVPNYIYSIHDLP